MISVILENCSDHTLLPSQACFREWIARAITATGIEDDREINVRVVNNEESRELNQRYRGQNKPTNVLSFPCELPPEVDLPLLGDLVICAPVVLDEAKQQGKSAEAHFAHMAIHGALHLVGYDHIDESDAEQMESLETEILRDLGYADPYEPLSNLKSSHRSTLSS